MPTPPRFRTPTPTAVLVSGSGRTLRNLLVLEREGQLPTEIRQVVASRPGIKALDHAAEFDVPACVAKPDEISALLSTRSIEFVVMAGYLRRWPLPPEFEGRTINIHPALLPLFGGKGFFGNHVHRAVLESGMRVSGATAHFVTAQYDEGPIIAQEAVPALPSDSVEDLADRVFQAEIELLPRAIRQVLAGHATMVGGRTVFVPQ